jgi:predicted ATP-grasp superfamily ATP-dependent carboligase
MTALPRILVLDGQTTQALACVRSLGRAGYHTIVASHLRRPLAAWSRYCRGAVQVRDYTVESFAALRSWAKWAGVRVILPLTERTCLLCNSEAEAWAGAGLVLGCGPDDMLVRAFDKARTLERAVACGINAPPTRCPTSLDGFRAAALELGLPCVVKPRFSNALHNSHFLPDHGVGYVDRLDRLAPVVEARRQGEHWPIIQRYVSGVGKGVFALCDHGRSVSWFAHERLRDVRPSGSGSSLRRAVPLDERLRGPAERLLGDLGWHGPVMLEFRDDGENPPWLIELNGRFWGSLQLAILAGADFPVQWVRLLCGRTVGTAPGYREDVTLRWLWGDVKRLIYIMRGPPAGYPESYPRVWDGLRELLGRQPAGTRIETWDRNDRWPAVAEWVQGISELITAARNGGRAGVAGAH